MMANKEEENCCCFSSASHRQPLCIDDVFFHPLPPCLPASLPPCLLPVPLPLCSLFPLAFAPVAPALSTARINHNFISRRFALGFDSIVESGASISIESTFDVVVAAAVVVDVVVAVVAVCLAGHAGRFPWLLNAAVMDVVTVASST